MPINGFAHVNVSTKDLTRARKFYAEILGLKDGYRPPFSRPGAWMYLEDQPIVHISTARAPNPEPQKTDAFFTETNRPSRYGLWQYCKCI